MGRKKWRVRSCDKENAAAIAEACGLDPFAAYLLCSRGIDDEFAADAFLFDNELSDPFLLPDMDKAVIAIENALTDGKRITVFGDYDADGVTATALLYTYLLSRGAEVDYYIPDRVVDGYGLNAETVSLLKSRKTQMIITVDNGVAAVSEVCLAKELGIDVVITDHHKPGKELPAALAVVDAHREDYAGEFTEWAGVGIAFKLVSALEDDDPQRVFDEYADLVAIGTIADIVPLTGENRLFVSQGLKQMKRGERPGLEALRMSGGTDRGLSAMTVAFTIAPKLNAAGRMGSADRALKLLLAGEPEEAQALCTEISAANELRKKEEGLIEEAVQQKMTEDPTLSGEVLVFDGEGWHQGILGIVASHFCERFGKPVVIISRDGATAKGSGRSIEGFSLFDAFTAVSDTLTQFGGHTLAAGLSLPSENIPLFREKINAYAREITVPFPELIMDCKLNPAFVNFDLVKAAALLEPYGAGNPQPVFGLFGLVITGIQPVGNGRHLRLTLRRGGTSVTGMLFGMTESAFMFEQGDTVDLAVKLEIGTYLGEERLNIHISGIRFAGADDDAVLGSMRLYERFKSGSALSVEEAVRLCPDRTLQEKLYRYIRSKGSVFDDAEMLCKRIGLPEAFCAAVSVALDVFAEMSLIIRTPDNRVIPVPGVRADLERSRILSSLRLKEA